MITPQPQSEFFTARLTDRGELPWFEIRALASIGAGLLMRHLGDPKAINKLARLAVPFDGYRHNEPAKAMTGPQGLLSYSFSSTPSSPTLPAPA